MAKKPYFEKFFHEEGQQKPPKAKKVARPRPERKKTPPPAPVPAHGPMRINRFIALAGVCSRRDAEQFVREGKVQVNGAFVTDLSTKVDPDKDKVMLKGKRLQIKRFSYFLLNKPKNHISTMKDDRGRKTVMDIIGKVTNERVFPVGRLDRNTTGLLLFTNDGELAEKLSHPSHGVRKVYHVKLDRPMEIEDIEAVRTGIELEDGVIKADKIDYVENRPVNEVGIEIHSGRNRIVRRIFEHLGYEVKGLDRSALGPLTKKLLPRGHVRELTKQEVAFLRMLKPGGGIVPAPDPKAKGKQSRPPKKPRADKFKKGK